MDAGSSNVQTHFLEIYTNHDVISGQVTLPFRRVTEIMNSADRDYITVEKATVTPLLHPEQHGGPSNGQILVRRLQVLYTATFTDPSRPKQVGAEFASVSKVPTPCYGFIGPFVFHAHLYMRPGQPLIEILEMGKEQFQPFTQATVYLVDDPGAPPRRHEVIIINRAFLDAIYLL